MSLEMESIAKHETASALRAAQHQLSDLRARQIQQQAEMRTLQLEHEMLQERYRKTEALLDDTASKRLQAEDKLKSLVLMSDSHSREKDRLQEHISQLQQNNSALSRELAKAAKTAEAAQSKLDASKDKARTELEDMLGLMAQQAEEHKRTTQKLRAQLAAATKEKAEQSKLVQQLLARGPVEHDAWTREQRLRAASLIGEPPVS
eukprot:m.48853 g.48853  ORF g.48853 m.48853 type:complete len:205 (+) comp47823_c0_seq1:215-829(+)